MKKLLTTASTAGTAMSLDGEALHTKEMKGFVFAVCAVPAVVGNAFFGQLE